MSGPIINALTSGFTSKQIIDFLIRKFPQHTNKIRSAVSMGFSPNQVINFLTGGRKNVQEETNENLTEHERTLKSEKEKKQKVNQAMITGAGIGATALGGYALSRAIPSIVQNMAPGITQSPVGLAPTVGATQPPQGPAPITPPPIQQVAQSPAPPAIPTGDILNKYQGVVSKINDLVKSGNGADQIAAYFEKFQPSQTKKLEKEANKPIKDIVSEYLSQTPSPQDSSNIPTKKLAILPSGEMGEIESEKNGIAKLNVNGQDKHRKLDDLIESPLPEKDLADLYSDLLIGIEKETGTEVSRNVYWAGYNPKTNELAYVPHQGSLYIYDDISPEDAKELTNLLSERKSTGENYIGAWTQGSSSPIGAAMYQLIKKLQQERGGKGKEYSGKFEKIYDALEIAKTLAKKKHDEKKKAKKPRPS